MSSERSREREVHRYYQAWLESGAGFDAFEHETSPNRFHLDGTALRPSNDKALIAFAQLGCLRLNAKRGVVTLIGSTRQYILAEATKSLSLISDLGEDGGDDELWFGNASLPRSQGISEAALHAPDYTAPGRSGKQHTAKALVINDLTKHEQYSSHAIAGNGVTFYCGVPIVTDAGHTIGVYNVTDDKARDGLTAAELVFMQDMSKIVMRHLQTAKGDAARFRGEKMILGLSDFMRGRSTSLRLPPSVAPAHAPAAQALSHRRQAADENDPSRRFKGLTITNADPEILRDLQESESSSTGSGSARPKSSSQSGPQRPIQADETRAVKNSAPNPIPDTERPSHDGGPTATQAAETSESTRPSMSQKIEQVFARAATILRECAAADGVVFYDATSLNVEPGSHTAESKAQQRQIMEHSGTSEDSGSDTHDYSSSGPSTDSDGSNEDRSRILKTRGRKCGMLGYALDVSISSTANANTVKTLGLTERSLRHFVRRYPRGKAFYFDATGDMTASEGEGSDHGSTRQPPSTAVDRLEAAIKPKSGRYSTKAIAEELIRVVPGARNVVWLPLWDFYKQRWCAGMFLWSRRPDRLLTAQDDMSYLKTFGNSIMIEVSRIDAQFADEAKATFIANISHELRSPLHGVLGSVEFLQETALDDFQSSMSFNIENCAKTLLDTVEHVLDYAKINHMSAKFAKRPESRSSNSSMARNTLESDLNLADLFEKTIEAVYAGSTFRGAKNAGDHSPMAVSQASTADNTRTTRRHVQNGSKEFSSSVRVALHVERQASWWVRTQSGAISRIILNILGNALKYTDKGHVNISLTTGKSNSKDPVRKSICMTVKDTGRGMSPNFLRNHAFVPFNQESQFSEGVGLGLSIVRQIAQSLAGRVDLQSTQGVGTEIQITLALPLVANPPASDGADSTLSDVMEKTPGMTICFLDPQAEHGRVTEASAPDEAVQATVRELAETWFGMQTMRAATMEGVVADFFFYAEPPPIDYLLHHHGQHARRTEVPLILLTTNAFESASLTANGIHKLTDLGRILEVISQPCGPLKLATTLHRCLTRLHALAQDPKPYSTADVVEPKVHGSLEAVISSDDSQAHHVNESCLDQIQSPQSRLERALSSKDGSSSPTTASGPEDPSSSFVDPDSGHDDQEVNAGTQTTLPLRVDSMSLEETPGPVEANPLSPLPDDDEIRRPVLLVDDNEINMKLLVAFMEKAQYPYVTAKDGLQAVQGYEEASADPARAFKYIFMDISMPIMDGIEATRVIRRHERKEGIEKPATIITLTGLSIEGTRKDMIEAGADYFLSKPVKFKDLIRLMRAC